MGAISAPTNIRIRADEYDELNANAEELHSQIVDVMSADMTETLENLIDIHRKMESISSEDSYTRGFRDGARILLDMLCGD